jgi:lipoate-protein ligase B
VHAYVHDLEEVVLRTLAAFDIQGNRNSHPGVWVGQRQIAAIGIAIKRWITMHGIALNVTPQQDRFSLINPCGIAGVPVTSVWELKGEHVAAEDVADAFVTEFASTFEAIMEREAAETAS